VYKFIYLLSYLLTVLGSNTKYAHNTPQKVEKSSLLMERLNAVRDEKFTVGDNNNMCFFIL